MDQPALTVRQEILIAASPERVFEAWADPVQIARWYVDAARGDARRDRQISWILGGQAEPLEVTACEPGRRLLLRNVGDPPWAGTELVLELMPTDAGTRTVVMQQGFAPELVDHVPNVDDGWACTLAVLKEHLEHHPGQDRQSASATREVAPDAAAVARTLSSAAAIAAWAGQTPARLAASTARGAVVVFSGFPGVFTLMGTENRAPGCDLTGALHVWYSGWGPQDLPAAQQRAQDLAQRWAAVLGQTPPAPG